MSQLEIYLFCSQNAFFIGEASLAPRGEGRAQVSGFILEQRAAHNLRDSTSLPSSSVGALGWGANRQAILSQELHIERLTAVPNLGLAIVLASRDASPLARHFVSAGM